MEVYTLQPGLLVSLSARITGNVSYRSRDIEAAHLTEDGALKAVWETQRTTLDPVEHEEAIKVRGKCRALITAQCAMTRGHGLLCPESNRAKLDDAITEAQKVAREFNRRARLTSVGVYVICGYVASDDVQAVNGINSEIRSLLDEMESGVRNLDASAIRDAANKARGMKSILTDSAKENVQRAIESARICARKIVKTSEQASLVVDQNAIRAITDSRAMFLDLDIVDVPVTLATESRTIDDTLESEQDSKPLSDEQYYGKLDFSEDSTEFTFTPVKTKAVTLDLED